MDSEALLALAFNRGSDARLLGRSRLANPYAPPTSALARAWDHGWHHVQSHWGHGACGRWKVSPLPLLELTAEEQEVLDFLDREFADA